MSVKVVTDSTSDIPPEVAQALGITVVPVYVRFGDEVYRDGVDRLYEFVANNHTIQDLAIAYSTVPEQANQLKARLGTIFPEQKIHVTQLGAALGVHGGPGTLTVALRVV